MELNIIKTQKQYGEYCRLLMDLYRKDPSEEVNDNIEHLSLLIEDWHSKTLPEKKKLNPIELLKSFMDDHGLKQKHLAEILNLSEGTISKILHYRKGLSKDVIRNLAEYFKVRQEAF